MARKRKLLTTVGRRRKSKGTVFDPAKHQLVPKHSKISEKEKKELLEKYNITFKELPKILITDPLVQRLKLEPGDVIKIERSSLTAGKTVYYRGVIIG